jgi:hypothetical protein
MSITPPSSNLELETAWKTFQERQQAFENRCQTMSTPASSSCNYTEMIAEYQAFLKVIEEAISKMERFPVTVDVKLLESRKQMRTTVEEKIRDLKRDASNGQGKYLEYQQVFDQSKYAYFVWILIILILLGMFGAVLVLGQTSSSSSTTPTSMGGKRR